MSVHTFHEFCKQQLMRFSGARSFPSPEVSPEAFAELLRVLEARVSRGERPFVERLIDDLLEASEFCPTVADLVSGAQRIRTEASRRREDAAVSNQQKDWRQQYGAPEAFDQASVDLRGCRARRKGREEMERKMVLEFRKNSVKDMQNVSWRDWFSMQERLGYELTKEQRKLMNW